MILNYFKFYRYLRGGFWSKVVIVRSFGHRMAASEHYHWQRGQVNCKEKYYIDQTEFYK
jgi:hypothetical protein